MKKTILLMILLPVLLSAQSFQQPGFTGDAGVVSRYIWRGYDMMPDNSPVAQLNVNYNFGMSGFSLAASATSAFQDRKVREANEEFIVAADYSRTGEKLGFSAGVTNYYYPGIDGDNRSLEVYAGLSFQTIIMFPVLTFYYDFDLGDDWYVSLAGSQFVPIGERLFTMSWALGYNNGQFGTESGISHVDIRLSTDVFPLGVKLTPEIAYVATPGKRVNNESEWWFGARWSF